jgi:hypothetical protein
VNMGNIIITKPANDGLNHPAEMVRVMGNFTRKIKFIGCSGVTAQKIDD